jgi:uncharacterized membrane protein
MRLFGKIKYMRLGFIPKTKWGRLSVGLIIGMLILFFMGFSFKDLLYKSVPAGNTILEDIVVRPALALTMLAGMAFGVFAFITGLTSIIKQRERALSAYVATIMGGLLILFLLGEIFFPH